MSAEMAQTQTELIEEVNNAVELVEWLNNSCSVGVWRPAENFVGAIVEEAMSLDPTKIPDGWRIKQIAGSHVHIEQDEGWQVVDERPFECPNSGRLLEIESATSLYCPECGYSRTVIDYVGI